MKRILIFSDTHGYTDPCIEIINNSPKPYAIIHAGDYTRDAEDLSYIYPDIPLYYVKGNNDMLSRAPSDITIMAEGAKIFVTHGHEQRVKYEPTLTTLKARAARVNPSLVIFGHTHSPYTEYWGSAVILNPGSVRYSKTYAVAEIDKGKVTTKILDIE